MRELGYINQAQNSQQIKRGTLHKQQNTHPLGYCLSLVEPNKLP